jgi:hypothetical protein
MKIDLPLNNRIALQINSGANSNAAYPTGKIQKGLVLFCGGRDLSEEAVGFGVPILKRGLQSIFPGEVEIYPLEDNTPNRFTARYKLNLEEKIARSSADIIENRYLYASKNMLAALIRFLPILRKLLTGTSNLLRSTFSLKTTYEPTDSFTYVTINYTIHADAGEIIVELTGSDSIPNGISEIILMNEQGAHFFDQYQEADGIPRHGREIGCWDEVSAPYAAFISTRQQISFSLPQVNGARLYRGRELIGTRLAWSGFGYSFPPSLDHFSYKLTITKLL